jgi:hypothetical protein
MPNWKKVITSGSDAALNSLLVTTSLTASGLIYPSTDGTTGQVVTTDGAGNLSFSNVENTTISIKNVSGVTIQKGTPCYITGSGTSGNLAGVWPADASNPLRMPAGVIAGETLTAGAEGIGLINGFIANVATSVFNAGDSIYVAAGGGYTNVRPTGSSILVQKLGNVEKSHPTNGSGVINGPGYYNDLPNVQSGYTWVGNSNGVAVAIATSSIQNVISASFSSTSSYVNTLNQNVTVNGNFNSLGTGVIGSATSLSSYTIDDGVSSMMDYDQIDLWSAYTVTGEILWNEPINETILRGQLVTKTPGGWVLAENKTSQGIFSYMLGIALDNADLGDRAPILLKGMVTTTYNIDQSSADSGTPVYMDGAFSGGPGNMSSIPQTHPGFTVRVVGYTYINSSIQSSGNYVLRFDPSSTWVEL